MNPRLYLSPPHMSGEEERLVCETFASNWIAPLGPMVDAFEQEMCARLGLGHAVALSSGTAGLHLAGLLLDLKPGDEVLVSTLTFAATVNAVCYCGAVPVFIDSTAESWKWISTLLVAEELDRCAALGRPAHAR